MPTYAITGSSGYLGTRMTARLLQAAPDNHVIGIDLVPPRVPHPRLEFHRRDVRDPALRELLAARAPRALLHFAFVLDPLYDEEEMTDIDVGGTVNVLRAARAAGVRHIVATSSTVAYGAHADNPVPLGEDAPLRAEPTFRYAHDKRLMDGLLTEFAATHPEVKVCVVRPCIVLGPHVANYIATLLLTLPAAALLGGANPELQFVHEDDLITLLDLCLEREAAGVFNAVGRGTIDLRTAAALQGKRAVPLPVGAAFVVAWAAHRLHLTPYSLPPGVLDFFRHPWVASGARAECELGFRARYSAEECFTLVIGRRDEIARTFRARLQDRRDHRRPVPGPPPPAPPAAPPAALR